MSGETYGVPRPYGFSMVPRATARLFNPAYASSFPTTSGTQSISGSPAFSPVRASFAAPSDLGLPRLDLRQIMPSNFVNAVPFRLAYPPATTNAYQPQSRNPLVGAAVPPAVVGCERAVQPTSLEPSHLQNDSSPVEKRTKPVQPSRANANNDSAAEGDAEDEEEIDVVGGLEGDEEVIPPVLTEERVESEGWNKGDDEKFAQEDRQSDARSSESEDDDEEEDEVEGAASSGDESAQDGTVEEDGHFVGT